MERIVYRKTLDVHKSGVQFTLQGFETADKMARRLELSLMASGDTIDIPLEQITAMMYVTTPKASEPSINECIIKDNKIIYDVLPIVEEGITEMQLKLIETSVEGAKSVLATPKLAVEVIKSNTDDESAEQTTTFTALEDAIAQAKGVYDSRLIRIELDSDCMFLAYYADGSIYETDVLKKLFIKGDVLLSQSYAKGGTGIRTGEDADNSMYYSDVSKSASEAAKNFAAESKEVLTEVRKHGVYTAFTVDFESGDVEYVSPSYRFNIDKESGELEAVGVTYSFEDTVKAIVLEWLSGNNADISALKETSEVHSEDILQLKQATAAHAESIDALMITRASHSEAILTLSESSSANNTAINELRADHDIAVGRVNDLRKDVDVNTEDIKTLSDKCDNFYMENSNELANYKASNNTRITELEKSMNEKFIITADAEDARLQAAPEGTVWICPLE